MYKRQLVYEENGELCFEVTSEEFDPMFDEIGSQLKIKELQRDKQLSLIHIFHKMRFIQSPSCFIVF